MPIKKYTVKEYCDSGFGFPVLIKNVEVAVIGDEEIPLIDYRRLEQLLIEQLPSKRGRLTGNELKFVRLHFGLTLAEFGKRFDVTHAGVKRWEDRGPRATNMNWCTEKDIRLYVLSRLRRPASAFMKMYGELTEKPQEDTEAPVLQGKQVKAPLSAIA